MATYAHDLAYPSKQTKIQPKWWRIDWVMVKTCLDCGFDYSSLNIWPFWLGFGSFLSSQVGESIPVPTPVATHASDPCRFKTWCSSIHDVHWTCEKFSLNLNNEGNWLCISCVSVFQHCSCKHLWLLSSEFRRRYRVRSRGRRWLQLVGCTTLLMDASNFGGPDGVGESGVEPRGSLRKMRAS